MPRGTPGIAAGWPSRSSSGLISADDLAGFSATVEDPVSFDFRGWTVFKTGPWGQGPVFLQQLALLEGFELGEFLGVEHVHTVIECAKLAFADREAWYGDSAPVPLEWLLSRRTPAERRALVARRGVGRAAAGRAGRATADDRTRRGGCRGSASRRAATPAISTSPTGSGTS